MMDLLLEERDRVTGYTEEGCEVVDKYISLCVSLDSWGYMEVYKDNGEVTRVHLTPEQTRKLYLGLKEYYND